MHAHTHTRTHRNERLRPKSRKLQNELFPIRGWSYHCTSFFLNVSVLSLTSCQENNSTQFPQLRYKEFSPSGTVFDQGMALKTASLYIYVSCLLDGTLKSDKWHQNFLEVIKKIMHKALHSEFSLCEVIYKT